MRSGHTHILYRHGTSTAHRMPAHVKILALLGFILGVVLTPRTAWWAFVVDAAVIALVARAAHIPWRWYLPRLVVEVPFLVFALLLPFLAPGPRVEVLGVAVSAAGLAGAGNLLAKGTLGVLASLTLAATTDARAFIIGLQRLRLPAVMVEVAAFMVRYLDVVADDMQRMRIAREARGFQARGPADWRVLGTAAGALFIRSFERGERIHTAMLSRGYTGRMPLVDDAAVTAAQWRAALLPPTAAALTMLVATTWGMFR